MEVSQRFFAMWPGYGTLSIMNWTVLPPNSCVEILAFSTSRAAVLCLVAQSSPTLCDPMDCSSPGSSVHWDSPGKNTGVGCHALLQGIFLTQGLNPGLLHCRWILYCLWEATFSNISYDSNKSDVLNVICFITISLLTYSDLGQRNRD